MSVDSGVPGIDFDFGAADGDDEDGSPVLAGVVDQVDDIQGFVFRFAAAGVGQVGAPAGGGDLPAAFGQQLGSGFGARGVRSCGLVYGDLLPVWGQRYRPVALSVALALTVG